MKNYLVIGQGEYSDYSVYFIQKSLWLTNEEHLFLLGIDEWDTPEIEGEFQGKFISTEKVRVEDIKTVATHKINGLFYCIGMGRRHIAVLDREYSKKELFIILKNNRNGNLLTDHDQEQFERNYKIYLKAYKLYLKMK